MEELNSTPTYIPNTVEKVLVSASVNSKCIVIAISNFAIRISQKLEFVFIVLTSHAFNCPDLTTASFTCSRKRSVVLMLLNL